MLNAGLSLEDVKRHIYVVDVNGLVLEEENLEDYKQPFAQPKDIYQSWTLNNETPTLLEVVENLKPHVLIGLSGATGIFDEQIVRVMIDHHASPVIFPFSNPNANCEATPEAIIKWSLGRAIVATGSPFPDVNYQNVNYEIRQGNNAFIFPGLGLAAVIGECQRISDEMILESAYALADYIQILGNDGHIYPPIRDLKKISTFVATRVLAKALEDGSATRTDFKDTDLSQLIEANLWRAEYLPYRYAGDSEV